MAFEKSRRAGHLYLLLSDAELRRLVRFWAAVELKARGIDPRDKVYSKVVSLALPWVLEGSGAPWEAVDWACTFVVDRRNALK